MNSDYYKIIFALIFSIIANTQIFSQETTSEVVFEDSGNQISEKKKKKLPYFMDDVMVVGGINQSGLYFSNNYRNLAYQTGFNIGFEKYFPMPRVLFISTGVHYTHRNLRHKVNNVIFINRYIDLPAFFTFALPEFRKVDFRFLVGTQLSFKLNSKQVNQYTSDNISNDAVTTYSKSDFNVFDIGWVFGASAEYQNFIFRLRSNIGTTNFIKRDPGSFNTVTFDVGYFIFRPFRNNKR